MDTLLQRVMLEETRSGKQSGVILVLDLEKLNFDSHLIGILTGLPISSLTVLAGPFRIMWGTLIEQYPQLIDKVRFPPLNHPLVDHNRPRTLLYERVVHGMQSIRPRHLQGQFLLHSGTSLPRTRSSSPAIGLISHCTSNRLSCPSTMGDIFAINSEVSIVFNRVRSLFKMHDVVLCCPCRRLHAFRVAFQRRASLTVSRRLRSPPVNGKQQTRDINDLS
jgi:hypothetical protein